MELNEQKLIQIVATAIENYVKHREGDIERIAQFYAEKAVREHEEGRYHGANTGGLDGQ